MKILPCPFCAGPAELARTSPPSDVDTPAYFCRCTKCGVTCGGHFPVERWQQGAGWVQILDAAAQAVAKWNTRAPNPDVEDAAKWRALRGCSRITAMGSAGLGPEKAADHYGHVTLNFWTCAGDTFTGDPGPAYAREWLDAFVAKALRNRT